MESDTRLGSYRVLESLGKGGMGEVYRARDAVLQRDVALKLLPEDLSGDPERLGRLQREARALAALNHPHIATVYGFEQEGDTRFIVMELVAGVELAERIREASPELAEALEIAAQIAEALEVAHAAGIVHRDLKPDNVKITPDGTVKVLDFGLAKKMGDGESAGGSDSVVATATVPVTSTGTVMGTPPYMSPEQIRAERPDQRTDIWAFGCVLYELLAGTRAFARETPSDTLAAILKDEPDWERLPPGTPEPVVRMLRRCLRKEKERRLHHIADARIEIQEAIEQLRDDDNVDVPGQAVSTRPAGGVPGAPAEAPAWASRAVPFAVTVIGLVLVAALAAVAYWMIAVPGGPRLQERSVAVLPFDVIGGEAENPAFVEGIHGGVLTELSRISDLKVISRTSVMQYSDGAAEIPAIAEALGVASVLEGTVQEAEGRVRVSVQLIDGRRDTRIWAETYDRELTARNIFEIQSDLAREIAGQLQATLTPGEESRVAVVPTGDLEAYNLYVQGRALLDQRTPETMAQSVEYFERAVGQDEGYAPAWAGLADALLLLEAFHHVEPGTLVRRGERAVERALELRPGLGEAHASRALLHYIRRQGPEAIAALERAVELRPSYAEAHNLLSYFSNLMGDRETALESSKRAVELDPLSPGAASNLSISHLINGDPENALAEAERTRRMQPDYASGHLYQALAAYRLGRYEEARETLLGLTVPWAGSGPLATLALARIAGGEIDLARQILATLENEGDAFNAGLVMAALGDRDSAFDAFRGIEIWSDWSTIALRHLFPGVLGPIRQDPRFPALIDAVDASWGRRERGR